MIKHLDRHTKPATKRLATLLASLGVCFGLATTQAHAGEIDPNTGEGAIKLNRKLHCSLKDGEETTWTWAGNAYSRVQGQRDRHLFKLLGMNVRQCVSIQDPKRGTGYRMVSREIMLYLDPKTGELLDSWENPWTGETNEVIHVANDPVNGRPNFPRDKDGKETKFPATFADGSYFMPFEIPLFYPNPLGGDYQPQIGGTYHSAEIFDFMGNSATLLDDSTNIEYGKIAWVRISQWLPWMNMAGRDGDMYFNAVGRKLKQWDDLPELLKKEIKANYPKYRNAPPADDQRKNETSWTYMKKIIDKRRAEKKD